jgi:hypothetical protein
MRDLGFFDIGQIAKLESGVTTRTIRNRVAAGRFPPPDAIVDGVQCGRRVMFSIPKTATDLKPQSTARSALSNNTRWKQRHDKQYASRASSATP